MRWKTRAIAMVVVVVLMAVSFVIPVSAISDDEVAAPSAILMEPNTGKILYEKNANELRPCASITKVMTLLLVMEAIDSGKISLEDHVTASAHAASMGRFGHLVKRRRNHVCERFNQSNSYHECK